METTLEEYKERYVRGEIDLGEFTRWVEFKLGMLRTTGGVALMAEELVVMDDGRVMTYLQHAHEIWPWMYPKVTGA